MTDNHIAPQGAEGNGLGGLVSKNDTLTMSTRDIAELCEKRHDNVMRDTKVMLEGLEMSALTFEGSYVGDNGKALPCYNLPKDLTLTLVAGYNVKLRKRIIDRWMELEDQEARRTGANVHFLIPQTLPEALRLAADLAETVEKQKARIEADQPKVAFHDGVTEAINCQSVEEVAKVLGTGQNRLFKWLREMGILMPGNRPYQRFIDDGYFRVVEKQYKDKRGESHTYTRTLVTGKGLAYVQRRFTDGGEAA
jgi:anti-repressor protein